jgi:hypothetical protein
MAKLFEGPVAIVPVKAGSDVFKLTGKASGKHSAANPQTIVDAVKANKLTMSGWSIWADGFEKPLAAGADVSAAAFLKLVKEADMIELVLVRGKFPQPKLKITKGAGSRTATKATPSVEF